MKRFCSTLSLLLGSVAIGNANTVCSTGITPSVPTFSESSTVGVVADFTLSCVNNPAGVGVFDVNFTFFLNDTILDTAAWSLTQGANTYSGTYAPPNEIAFTGVAYDPSAPALSFELHGVEVNPSAAPDGFPYYESLGINGDVSVPVFQPTQLVGENATPEPSALMLASIGLGMAGAFRFTKRGRERSRFRQDL